MKSTQKDFPEEMYSSTNMSASRHLWAGSGSATVWLDSWIFPSSLSCPLERSEVVGHQNANIGHLDLPRLSADEDVELGCNSLGEEKM